MTTSGEQELARGTMNLVTRSGDWVLRPAGAHTPFVKDLLAVLAGAGCGWAPRPGGLTEDERVSFLAGSADWELLGAGGDPYAPSALVQAMRWVRRLHDTTASGATGEVTCHGDLGAHNLIYDGDGGAAGLIDFDLAHRGSRADVLAAALKELGRLGRAGGRATRCGRRFSY